jgi:restriction system protein
MARRGFFAELNYQAQQAEKRQRQQAAAVNRAQAAAQREAERALRASERAYAAASRASAAEQKAAEKAAREAHLEARAAEVASMNADLQQTYSDIDGLLTSTLEVDDHIDLETLKITAVEHPPFEPGAFGTPVSAPAAAVYPPEPVYSEPPAPRGLSAAFGGKRKHEEAVAAARIAYETDQAAWRETCAQLHTAHTAEVDRRGKLEQKRQQQLAEAQAKYQEECRQREADAEERNKQLTQFINDLAFDVESAIQEYVGVVLSNSVYPDTFPVAYDHRFDLASRELTLTVTVPEPDAMPAVKEYRYVKAKDEIVPAALPVKEQKQRYANAVWQVAIRTLHEIFEADRAGKVRSIALTVGASRVSPATGLPEDVPLVIVAADRDTFASFDLAKVEPQATLTHLGAAVSKSPFDLTPADTSAGVRRRAQ